MSFLGGLFGAGGPTYEAYVNPQQAQQLYNQQQEALKKQREFTTALQAQAPEAIAQQQALAGQLAAQAQGKGPSVARTQLAQTTGENIAAQQALMAGQRGASANVGAMARQAGLLGARTQQQAAGQAATLRAQEQLAAQAALAGLTGQQLEQIRSGQQLGISGTTAAQQNVLAAMEAQNKARAAEAQRSGGIMGSLIGAAGTILGGPIGGAIAGSLGSALSKKGPAGSNVSDYTSLAAGGEVKAMVSPGERYLPPQEVKKVAQGKKEPVKAGVKIPGQAKVKGDSLKNDTVPMTLEEGGIVIPRSVMQSDDAAEKARRFVAAVLAKKQHKRK